MPYIGNEVGNRFVASKAASVYSGDGSTTAFTLEHSVGSDEDILVSVDGVVQEPSVAYAVSSGTTLTFTAAPSSNSGNNIFVYYLFRTVATVDHPSTSSLQATDGTFTAGITGTLQTAAQTNITSVGTLTSFRSTGIDDNADALALTIDSSENVMIGKTATGISNAGHSFKNDGTLEVRRDISSAGSSSVGYISRGSSDGAIITFYRDTTSRGSIGVSATDDFYISASTANHSGLYFGTNIVYPMTATSLSDNATSLGHSSNRFKDLYLSGNIYIGGTGSANGLDDYEEGTWTPVMKDNNSTTVATSNLTAQYTKIGKFVTVEFTVQRNNSSSLTNLLYITGLPFTTTNVPALRGHMWVDNASSDIKCFIYVGSSNTEGFFPKTGTNDSGVTTNEWINGRYLYGSLTYITA